MIERPRHISGYLLNFEIFSEEVYKVHIQVYNDRDKRRFYVCLKVSVILESR
jgi:hypothetical protein